MDLLNLIFIISISLSCQLSPTKAVTLEHRYLSPQDHYESGLDEINVNEFKKRVNGGKPVDPMGLGVGLILMTGSSSKVGLCTGTFVSKNLMLTAAHCVNNNKAFNIFVPQTNQSDPGKTTILMLHDRASNVYYDSTYHLTPEMVPVNDVALLQFAQPYMGQLMRLDRAADRIGYNVGQALRVCGFGETETSAAMKPGWFPFACLDGAIQPSQMCKTRLKGSLDQNQFCLEFISVGSTTGSACHGDSGGPSWSLGRLPSGESVLVQVGVTSWGAGDCNSNVTVFTRIVDYQSVVARVVCTVQGSDDSVCKLYSDGQTYASLSPSQTAVPHQTITRISGVSVKTSVAALQPTIQEPDELPDELPDKPDELPGERVETLPIQASKTASRTRTSVKTTSRRTATVKSNSAASLKPIFVSLFLLFFV
jgi:hypothetical protein